MRQQIVKALAGAALVAVGALSAGVAQAQVTQLSNGVSVTGLSGAAGSKLYFVINVPAGRTKLNVSISGGTGDVTLYLRRGVPPTLIAYDCRSIANGGMWPQICAVSNPVATNYYVMLIGNTVYSGLALQAAAW